MARVPGWARKPHSERGRGHPAWRSRAAVAFLVGLLLLATASCSVSRASGSPAGATTWASASGAPRGPAPAATTTAAAGPPSFTIVASGDVLPHTSVVARARAYGRSTGRSYDFRPMLSAIKPIVSSANLAICHIETPLSPTGGRLSGYPSFNGPPQIATAVRDAGYDACSAASNHSLDQGPQGVSGTLQVLDRAGLRHAGIARSPREARPTMLDVKGAKVAMLSYAYGFNGRKVPAGQPWRANRIDPARILADARAARRAGSQFTVVFLHWGQEYQTAPTPWQLSVARQLLADPSIDLILGHHVHVVQPARQIEGKWVAFGMGNLLSAQSSACCPANTQDGVIMHVRVVRSAGRYVVGQLDYIPTYVQHPSFRVLPVVQTLARGGLDAATRSALVVSLRRTRAAMGPQVHPVAP
jgi:poly-gamma-glutamate capsule biosynthesis protein CapA/YwtB (metallophosphatase superfamily)